MRRQESAHRWAGAAGSSDVLSREREKVCENLSSTQGALLMLQGELWVQLHPGNREVGPESSQSVFFLL